MSTSLLLWYAVSLFFDKFDSSSHPDLIYQTSTALTMSGGTPACKSNSVFIKVDLWNIMMNQLIGRWVITVINDETKLIMHVRCQRKEVGYVCVLSAS